MQKKITYGPSAAHYDPSGIIPFCHVFLFSINIIEKDVISYIDDFF